MANSAHAKGRVPEHPGTISKATQIRPIHRKFVPTKQKLGVFVPLSVNDT
jgi:hypothetical protein